MWLNGPKFDVSRGIIKSELIITSLEVDNAVTDGLSKKNKGIQYM